MRVLILGATGMLGHKMVQVLGERMEVCATMRGDEQEAGQYPALAGARIVGGVEATDIQTVAQLLDDEQPDALINCVGVIKQLSGAKDPITAISINALLPHQLAKLCQPRGIRLIHFSTDCVFSGKKGPYKDDDFADADDLYGRSKYLGEVDGPGCLTIRSSIVGRELKQHAGLFDWFISNQGGAVRGFTGALYSGLTTNAMAGLVGDLLEHHPGLSGVWQVSSEAINKYELLQLVNRIFGLKIHITPDEGFFCDRRLNSSRFRKEVGFSPKSWPQMIQEMHADPTVY